MAAMFKRWLTRIEVRSGSAVSSVLVWNLFTLAKLCAALVVRNSTVATPCSFAFIPMLVPVCSQAGARLFSFFSPLQLERPLVVVVVYGEPVDRARRGGTQSAPLRQPRWRGQASPAGWSSAFFAAGRRQFLPSPSQRVSWPRLFCFLVPGLFRRGRREPAYSLRKVT